MRDPTIPRHGKPPGHTSVWGPTVARLVDYGDRVVFVDLRTGYEVPCELSTITYLSGPFGNAMERVHAPPRPWKFDPSTGEVLIEGDQLLVVFLGNDHRHPVVLGGASSGEPEDPEMFPAQPLGTDPDPIRVRKARRDSNTGAALGTLQITTLDGGNGFDLVVGGSKFGEGSRLTIDHDAGTIEVQAGSASGPRVILDAQAGTIKLGQGSETHQVGFGEAMVQALKTLAEAILAVDASQAAKLPSSAPVATATVTPIVADCVASLAAGPPYLSTIVKVQ